MNTEHNHHKYDHIIHLPHHISTTHPRMSEHDRAAQFSPFAALTGYNDAIKETARYTDRKMELDELEKERLDEKIQLLERHLHESPEVTLTYFQPDERKEGGVYLCVTGTIKKIDHYQRSILMQDQQRIFIEDVIEIDSNFF